MVLRTERVASSASDLRFDPRDRGRDGLLLDVYRVDRRLWTGVFAFKEVAFDAVAFVPRSTSAVVVSHGQGYVVDALRPTEWKAVNSAYFNGAIASAVSRCVVVHDEWALYAVWNVRRIGVHRLEADGIHQVQASEHFVEGTFEAVSSGVF